MDTDEVAKLMDLRRYHDGTAAYKMTGRWLPETVRTEKFSKIMDADFALVFAGTNSRVRSDRGVPWYLGQMVGEAKITIVSIV